MTSELDASSEDDFDLEYSETESASPVDHDQVALSKLYWLGKLYFRSALARQVLGNPLPEATEVTVVDLDVQLEAKLRDYDYGPNLELLHQKIDSISSLRLKTATSDDYEALLCAVGSIVSSNNNDHNDVLDQSLRHFGGGAARSSTEMEQTAASQGADYRDGHDLQLWFDALEKSAGKLDFTVTAKSKKPTLFEATISVKDLTFTDTGTSTTIAKCRAARKACRALQIRAT